MHASSATPERLVEIQNLRPRPRPFGLESAFKQDPQINLTAVQVRSTNNCAYCDEDGVTSLRILCFALWYFRALAVR